MIENCITQLAEIDTWPVEVFEFLEKYSDAFLNWHLYCYEDGELANAAYYDWAIKGLSEIISAKMIVRGYHCTRLTDYEINAIKTNGMSLPNFSLLNKRIDTLVESKLISLEVAQLLKRENDADDKLRKDILWFCFDPPKFAGQPGIERFFRSWGGEALYNSHEERPLSGEALTKIGVPCLVEANVKAVGLKGNSLAMNITRRFLLKHNLIKKELNTDFEGYTTMPISPSEIVTITQYPEPRFIELTGCNDWYPQL